MTRFNTVALDRTAWDLVLDSTGNIALCTPPYALAQDVASACRLFLSELWFDTAKGVPYFQQLLGHIPPNALISGYEEAAALTVPGVVSAQCSLTQFDNRRLSGVIAFIDETNAEGVATF